jgi:double-stranded uracil-DNA glycosylase
LPVLGDLLEPGMKVVFCGTAVGPESARRQAYYAGPGNQFWDVLYRVGLVTRRLEPADWTMLRDFRIGLTDLAKEKSGVDEGLTWDDFDPPALRAKLERFAPKALAFNGKKAAQIFYGHGVTYGRQPDTVGSTRMFVLPSTSAAARRYWDESHWRALADDVGRFE